MGDLRSIIKAYDVRGVVPDEWDEDVARRIGAAFAEFVRTEKAFTTTLSALNNLEAEYEIKVRSLEDAGRRCDLIDRELASGILEVAAP